MKSDRDYNYYTEIQMTKNMRLFLVSVSSLMTIYIIAYVYSVWDNPNYSKIGLIIAYVLPSSIFLLYSIIYTLIHKIIITEKYIEDVSIRSKKFFFEDISKVNIGPNFITLFKSKRKSCTISWLYDGYDEVKIRILDNLRDRPDVIFTFKKKYKK